MQLSWDKTSKKNTQGKIVEAALIATEMAINASPEFFILATAAANLVKKEALHILQKED